MFHISFLIRDKHLAGTLRFLGNKAMNLETRAVQADDLDLSGPEPKTTEPKEKRVVKDVSKGLTETVRFLAATGDWFGTAELQAKGFSRTASYTMLAREARNGTLIVDRSTRPARYRGARQSSDSLQNHQSIMGGSPTKGLENAS